jgi:hypothetical protein
MGRRFMVCCLGPAFLAAGSAAAQAWSVYSPEGGHCRVDMLGTPKAGTAPILIGGSDSVAMTEAAVQAGKAASILSFVDYPDRIARAVPTDLLIDRGRDGMAAGSVLRNEKKITLGRTPGREFLVAESNEANNAVRLWWMRGRLYQLVVTSAAGIETRPDTRRFLDSFALLSS